MTSRSGTMVSRLVRDLAAEEREAMKAIAMSSTVVF
jgi:hypothetical protein